MTELDLRKACFTASCKYRRGVTQTEGLIDNAKDLADWARPHGEAGLAAIELANEIQINTAAVSYSQLRETAEAVYAFLKPEPAPTKKKVGRQSKKDKSD